MIDQTLEQWHQFLRGELPGGLDELLDDDVVFHSPIVFTPQRGKDVTKLYLSAAYQTFGGDEAGLENDDGDDSGNESKGGFRYVKEVAAGNQAILEFETTMNGKYVNGVDIISCNDAGRIVEFKVMIRPLQAVNAVHEQMRQMLDSMGAFEG